MWYSCILVEHQSNLPPNFKHPSQDDFWRMVKPRMGKGKSAKQYTTIVRKALGWKREGPKWQVCSGDRFVSFHARDRPDGSQSDYPGGA